LEGVWQSHVGLIKPRNFLAGEKLVNFLPARNVVEGFPLAAVTTSRIQLTANEASEPI
jgi:hypothetical protein